MSLLQGPACPVCASPRTVPGPCYERELVTCFECGHRFRDPDVDKRRVRAADTAFEDRGLE